MNRIKKTFSMILSVLFLISSLSISAFAASYSFSISGNNSVTVGNNYNVSVSIKGTEAIGGWSFSLNYDPACLEYVSGADSGGGGSVLFKNENVEGNSSTKTFSVKFKARRIGSTSISVQNAVISTIGAQGEMPQRVSASGASRKINIVAAPTLSAENNLSALTVAEGEITPAFDAKTTAYTLTVPFEVAALTVSATPKDNKARVAVSGAEALVVGENKINVTVTAENGKAKTYTITVVRQESELAGVTAEIGGTSYAVAHDPATLQIPAGFTPSTALLGEKKFLTYVSPKESVAIAYLYTESEGAWYVFDQAAQNFKPFQTLTGAANTVVILEPGKDVKIPKGFIPKSIAVGEVSFPGYQAPNSEDAKMYLVYGMAHDGTLGFFYYDATFGTFTTYFVPEDTEQKDAVKEAMALSNLLEDSEKKADQMEIIALAVGVIAALLLIGLIISLATRKKKKKISSETLPENVTNEEAEEEENFVSEEEEKEVKDLLHEASEEENAALEEQEMNPTAKKRKRTAMRTFSEISKKEE